MVNAITGRDVLWDAWLAAVPVLLAYLMLYMSGKGPRPLRRVLITIVAFAWIAFLPNSCYLLTEWRHFLSDLDKWDMFVRAGSDHILLAKLCLFTIAYLIFSGFGMLMFALAIRPIEKLINQHGIVRPIVWSPPFFVTLSTGVYLGLVLRLNSWDILNRPGRVWAEIAESSRHPMLILFILGFAIVLWLGYRIVDIWVDGVAAKLRHIS